MIENKKSQVRERILTLLRNQKEEERLSKSFSIAEKLYMMHEFKKASTILFYASFDGEVDTFEMMKESQKQKKRIALPCVQKDENRMIPRVVQSLEDLQQGPYGIQEPNRSQEEVKIDEIDLIVAPGVAFDSHNNRLGRGGGYYDRFLASLPTDTPTIGLAFDFQIVEQLPNLDPHDKAVSLVLSN